MERFWVALGLFMAVAVAYWVCSARTARRWNTLLRRAGQVADEDAIRRPFKLPLFILSSAHREFADPKLSRLVAINRVSMAVAFLAVVLWPILSIATER